MGAVATTNARITISAVDRASRTLDVINNKMARVQAPVRRVNQSLIRFSNLFGLTRARNALTALSRGSVNAFRSVSRIVPILGSITGATTLAGIYRLSSAWADFGTKMRTTARSMGMPTSRLMAMQNAARLSGGSADAMTGAMGQISQLKWEMPHGFAPEAAAQFQALGISMQEVAKSSPDKLFARIADRIRRIKDPAAQTIAAMKIFGQAGEGLLPIFQQSSKEFRENIELARRYGVMNQKGADAAANLKKAQTELTLAVEGFGFSVAEAVEPALSPVIHQMADWIAVNRQWIAQNIAQYIRQVVRWLRDGGWDQIKNGVVEVMHAITGVVDHLGGWQKTARDVAIGMGALWGVSVLAKIALLTAALSGVAGSLTAIGVAGGIATAAIMAYDVSKTGWIGDWLSKHTDHFGKSYEDQEADRRASSMPASEKMATGRKMQAFFQRNGYTADQAAGLVANFDAESGFDPNIPGDKVNGKYTAYGIGQWHKARQDDFRRVMGRDIHGSSLDDQLKFSAWELSHTEKSAGSAIHGASSAQAAAALASFDYFRPGEDQLAQLQEMRKRGVRGREWGQYLSAPPASVPSGSVAGGASAPAMQLDVHVATKGPHHVSARATSKSGGLKVRSVTQQRAMDPESTAVGQ
ncbi:phage tail tip lysozyme [Acetobacter cerevisiae]|uniref:Phage tail tip lysozyme n=1 Tax=Acetobacter cerevisiae TaxID=178900 RepID=A0ABT1ERG7_9PROT|nr:phage tail tip lysozyme [Acetobacter cerevisiae]MCP1255688.1 phage tail tip lysozyme [Acetobacter cerevisiae]